MAKVQAKADLKAQAKENSKTSSKAPKAPTKIHSKTQSKAHPTAKNPLILRYHRLLETFSKSDDERDFYLDRVEGFLLFVDLDKGEEELQGFMKDLKADPDRFCLIPKLSFYEIKKFMEGFVHEKIYDIDTKEKLLDIISSKEARENFLEFIYDHLVELDKWQQFYQERSRIRVIEALRQWNIRFVFEEDLDLPKSTVEKLKEHLFDDKVKGEVAKGRDVLEAKAKTYYSNEALNPRPKRGRPPKQQAKVEIEPQLTDDIYTTVPSGMRSFIFSPEYSAYVPIFSSKFESEEKLLASLKGATSTKVDSKLERLSQRLESLRHVSQRLKSVGVDEVPDLGTKEMPSLKKLVVEKQVEGDKGEAKKSSKLTALVKGALPKKRGRPSKAEMRELMEKKQKKGVTKVATIKSKKGSKK